MQYSIRAFLEGHDEKLDRICKVFCSMERTAYNLLREGKRPAEAKSIIRGRYGVTNARWSKSAINQASAKILAEKGEITYLIRLYKEKAKNNKTKMRQISNPMKLKGCETKILNHESRIGELTQQLRRGTYPRAVFGSRELQHRLSNTSVQRVDLVREWRERRSNHFFSVGEANQRGNANLKLQVLPSDSSFRLKVLN